MKDTIEMAREAGLLTWLKPPEDVIERFKSFEALVRADEREALQAEVLEQCRINGISAEREDALRAELTRLKASIALDKMAENARELGLDYEPAVQEPVAWVNHGENRITRATGWDGYGALCKCVCANPPAAQPDVQEKCFLCGERVASCTSDVCPKAAQPAPVKTYHDGKPWPVAPKPWVGLTDEDMYLNCPNWLSQEQCKVWVAQIEAKLKEKNHG